LKKRAEATSETRNGAVLPIALPKALFAVCAMNLFFNNLLEQTQ
jgi:hypothetical protein